MRSSSAATLVVLFLGPALVASTPSDGIEVHVVDEDSGTPITDFRYRAWITTAGDDQVGRDRSWTSVSDESGTFVMDVPASCELSLGVQADGYIYGYPYAEDFVVRADDPETRTITVRLKRGHIIHGVVQRGSTGEPVQGARVSHLIFTPPLFSPDRERSVITDENGRFTLTGVDSAFHVEHEEFLATEEYLPWDETVDRAVPVEVIVKLVRGESLSGVVVNAKGDPVEGASIEVGRRRAVTDEAGRFAVVGVAPQPFHEGDYYFIAVRANGYVDWVQSVFERDIADEGLAITIERLFRVRGRVVDADGHPVRTFRVVGGPGTNPAMFESSSRSIEHPNGEFELDIEFEDENWFGFVAASHAPVERIVPFDREAEPLTVTLPKGATVRGTLLGDLDLRGEVSLILQRAASHEMMVTDGAAEGLFSKSAAIDDEGQFELDHVAPGIYSLFISGQSFTGSHHLVEVRNTDLQLPAIEVAATGRIEGTVYNGRTGLRWAFANGSVHHPSLGPRRDPFGSARSFTADEDGNFAIDGVPAGQVYVAFNYNISADIIGSWGASVIVRPNETSRVVVNEPSSADTAPNVSLSMRVTVGDDSNEARLSGTALGSKRAVGVVSDGTARITREAPQFRVELVAADDLFVPGSSASGQLNPDGTLDIDGVVLGEYELRVFDAVRPPRFATDQPIYTGDVTVAKDTGLLEISLGGSSITGRVLVPPEREWREQYGFGIARVYAVNDRNELVREAVCDTDGNFCLRYLDAGRYRCYAWHSSAGSCEFNAVTLTQETRDLGEVALHGGATAKASISVVGISPMPTGLLLTHESGVVLQPIRWERRFVPEFVVRHLWPGEWTATLLRHDERLATTVFAVEDDGDVSVRLTVER